METKHIVLDPKTLGFWVKCIRDTSHWSQEALAANAGLDVRTVQRVEAGKPASLTTRRALARGLGYDNHDIFDSPDFIASVYKILGALTGTSPEAMEKQFPDHMRLPASRVSSGNALGRLADMANGLLPNMEEDLPETAKETAAIIFDYLRDLMDLGSDVPYSDKLAFNRDMGSLLANLEAEGAVIYAATRNMRISNEAWENKTPLPMTIVYLSAVPRDREPKEIMVPKRLAF
jgi:DNA-binding XRE family transcriptional regulator